MIESVIDLSEKDEIVATGDLFKQARKQVTNWKLRKFILVGVSLIYFADDGKYKGAINIAECDVRSCSPEECKNAACKFAFGVFSSENIRRCLLCATNENDRSTWISVLKTQIQAYMDVTKRFLLRNEMVLGSSPVAKKNMIGRETFYGLIITNYPRFIFVDLVENAVKEQIIFTKDHLPTVELVRT